MFLVSEHQSLVLSVLEKTGYMRIGQMCRLLQIAYGITASKYVDSIVRQLQYMQKIIMAETDIAALPNFSGKSVDGDMLTAIEIMLDLTESEILAVSTEKPPFKLCFLTEHESDIKSYAIAVVSIGGETIVNFQMDNAASDMRTVIYLLSDLKQRDMLHTSLPHFFALIDGGRLRYFKSQT